MKSNGNQKLAEQLRSIALTMKTGDLDSLGKLREEVVDLNLRDESLHLDETSLTALYIAKKFSNDIYCNLFTDATFEFPISRADDERMVELTRSFGTFLDHILNTKADAQSDVLIFAKAIKNYYDCLSSLASVAEIIQMPNTKR